MKVANKDILDVALYVHRDNFDWIDDVIICNVLNELWLELNGKLEFCENARIFKKEGFNFQFLWLFKRQTFQSCLLEFNESNDSLTLTQIGFVEKENAADISFKKSFKFPFVLYLYIEPDFPGNMNKPVLF